jgi:DNA-binding beta-propeller fold protein YncE
MRPIPTWWFVFLLFLSGCAARQPEQAFIPKWPEPPETTRIVFRHVVSGESDFRSPSFLRSILGIVGMPEPRGWHLRQPIAVAVTDDGERLYVSDYAHRAVAIFDFAKKKVKVLGAKPPLGLPIAVALAPDDTLLVSDQEGRRLLFLDLDGNLQKAVAITEVERPTGLAVDRQRGRIYIADGPSSTSEKHLVHVYDLDGRYLMDIGKGRGQRDGYLYFPTYVAVDKDGRVYVADSMNSRISCFESDGTFVRTYGKRGTRPGDFDKPKGIAFDTFGNLYAVDSSWSVVQIMNRDGDMLLYFGGRHRLPGFLQNPTAIAIDRNDRIYVADTLNFRVNVYDLVNTTEEDSIPSPAANGDGASSGASTSP